MTADRSTQKNRILALIFTTAVVALGLYLFNRFFGDRLEPGHPHANVFKIPALVLWALFAYFGVRVVNAAIFDFAFRRRPAETHRCDREYYVARHQDPDVPKSHRPGQQQ